MQTVVPLLSILIPVYNYDVSPLLHRLSSCLREEPSGVVEVVVVEDGSENRYTNRETAEKIPEVRYSTLEDNRGRAGARNALLDLARGEYVLFLDADMLPDREDFLTLYLEQCRRGAEVVCGGISYLQCGESDGRYAFYLYKSRRTEALPAARRQQCPWRYLFTSNVLVRRDIVERIRFDDRFSGYGFEDVEWGIRLVRQHALLHIDNTCSHMGIMTREEVYTKMRASMRNHALLVRLHPDSASCGAAALATYLRFFPRWALRGGEGLLGWLFHNLSSNPFLFLVFQLDKVILLALELKEESAR